MPSQGFEQGVLDRRLRSPTPSELTAPSRASPTQILSMFTLLVVVAIAPLVAGVYAYLVYPAILWLIAAVTAKRATLVEPIVWPTVTVTVPVYNAVSSIRATLDRLTGLDYPRDRLQLLVLSDASTD